MKAHTTDLRWRAIYAVWWDGASFSDIAERLSVSNMPVTAKWVERMWHLFEETGDVQDHQGCRQGPPANQIIDEPTAQLIIDTILDAPACVLLRVRARCEARGASLGRGVGILLQRAPPASKRMRSPAALSQPIHTASRQPMAGSSGAVFVSALFPLSPTLVRRLIRLCV